MFDLTNDLDKEMFILDKISELIGIESIKTEYKSNKIDENVETILVNFKELYEIIIHVYNNLNKDQYLLTRKCLKIVYEKVKGIIIKYNGFDLNKFSIPFLKNVSIEISYFYFITCDRSLSKNITFSKG